MLSYIPEDANLIEPFVGEGDLLSLFPNKDWECYDIEDNGINIVRDTLLDPPDYTKKWVITNPPYLAKNKSTDKKVYDLYKVDDLYKAAVLSLLNAEGGILIIPTNFLTDERTKDIRKSFFKNFEIKEANVFTAPIFESTTYSVCSFAFCKREGAGPIIFPINILPQKERIEVCLEEQYGYRLAGEFYNKIENIKPIFERLTEKTTNNITAIKLYALDTRTERIRLEICEEPFVGKSTDRCYATFTTNLSLSLEQQKQIVEGFNKELEAFRRQYKDLSMTNYRDYNRKRIGFDFAYRLATKVYKQL